jgi:hypothetical protein
MKKLLTLTLLLFAMNFISNAQPNSIGKNEVMVLWDLLGRDTITQPTNRTVRGNKWCEGDTTVMSIHSITPPDTIIYNSIYYFIGDICVKQRNIYLRDVVNYDNGMMATVDKIIEYNLADIIIPFNNPSSVMNGEVRSNVECNAINGVLPNSTPKHNN